ncbi:3792_t:CDS:2 [Ambispora gerdemannii]|uniref:3792_t:CDS:1 n=1 Tax=Ambispora gerdemannii TaxID=144530 RepID=A0A9N9A6X1_9GLOM|nr:3792_t:CDS:2 [Ambispora gerdemannii]
MATARQNGLDEHFERAKLPTESQLQKGLRVVYFWHDLDFTKLNANFDKYNYCRGKLYEDGTAICFGCMQLMRVNVNLGPEVFLSDLIENHWKTECSKTHDGYARKIQPAFREFRKRELSNARLAWNSCKNDSIPTEDKFLG